MHKNSMGWLILTLLVIIFCSSGTSFAMSAFSRKYKMQCNGCHTNQIPQLNGFGIEFYKNGFELPKQGDGTKAEPGQGGAAEQDATSGKEKASVKQGQTANDGHDDTDDEDEEEQPPPKKEIPPTVVYRSRSSDGTMFFTDTPERRKDFSWRQDDGEERPVAPQPVITAPPPKRKPVASRQRAKRPAVAGEAVKAAAKERFKSYEECMERQLVGARQPGSGQEMMEIMMEAERTCTAYPQGSH